MQISREEAIEKFGSHYVWINRPGFGHSSLTSMFTLVNSFKNGKWDVDNIILAETLGQHSVGPEDEEDILGHPQTEKSIADIKVEIKKICPEKSVQVINIPEKITLPFLFNEGQKIIAFYKNSWNETSNPVAITITKRMFVPTYASDDKRKESENNYSFKPIYNFKRGVSIDRGEEGYLTNQADIFKPTANYVSRRDGDHLLRNVTFCLTQDDAERHIKEHMNSRIEDVRREERGAISYVREELADQLAMKVA